MLRSIFIAGAIASMGVAGCSRADHSATPEHSAVAAAMPDAASTPGAAGPGAAAPHAPPPATATLSDTHPEAAGNASAAPATGGMAAAGSINQLDRSTPDAQSSGKANADQSP
jgi:hypothetical protein